MGVVPTPRSAATLNKAGLDSGNLTQATNPLAAVEGETERHASSLRMETIPEGCEEEGDVVALDSDSQGKKEILSPPSRRGEVSDELQMEDILGHGVSSEARGEQSASSAVTGVVKQGPSSKSQENRELLSPPSKRVHFQEELTMGDLESGDSPAGELRSVTL